MNSEILELTTDFIETFNRTYDKTIKFKHRFIENFSDDSILEIDIVLCEDGIKKSNITATFFENDVSIDSMTRPKFRKQGHNLYLRHFLVMWIYQLSGILEKKFRIISVICSPISLYIIVKIFKFQCLSGEIHSNFKDLNFEMIDRFFSRNINFDLAIDCDLENFISSFKYIREKSGFSPGEFREI